MPRKDHLPRQTRQEHITLQPNRSIEFRVTDDFGSFSPPHWHDALEIIYILEGSSIVTLSDRTKTVLPGQFLLINSGRIHTARCPSTGNRSILMQIPDAFLANYLPDPSQLWFSIDYDSTNPEVQKNISQFRRLLLSMMQLHEEMPDGYLLTFQRELFTFLDLLYTKFSEKSPLAHHPMSSRTQTRLDTILTYTQGKLPAADYAEGGCRCCLAAAGIFLPVLPPEHGNDVSGISEFLPSFPHLPRPDRHGSAGRHARGKAWFYKR